MPSFGAERDGVVDEIADDLAQALVAAHDDGVRRQAKVERELHRRGAVP